MAYHLFTWTRINPRRNEDQEPTANPALLTMTVPDVYLENARGRRRPVDETCAASSKTGEGRLSTISLVNYNTRYPTFARVRLRRTLSHEVNRNPAIDCETIGVCFSKKRLIITALRLMGQLLQVSIVR